MIKKVKGVTGGVLNLNNIGLSHIRIVFNNLKIILYILTIYKD